jgi:hypothetical protein
MGSVWPISRSEYYRREREILFEIELLLYRWGISDNLLLMRRSKSSATGTA